jgi:hypothetical protein
LSLPAHSSHNTASRISWSRSGFCTLYHVSFVPVWTKSGLALSRNDTKLSVIRYLGWNAYTYFQKIGLKAIAAAATVLGQYSFGEPVFPGPSLP